jgi:hypothetical protein
MFTYGALFKYSKNLTDDIDLFAGNLESFIEHRMWETGWWDEPSETMRYAPSLSEFVVRECPDGIGRSVAWVYASLDGPSKINKAASKALQMFDEAIKTETGEPASAAFNVAKMARAADAGKLVQNGANQHTVGCDNVTPTSERGNDQTYIVRRLLRDDPALADLVKSGKLSPHAAAVQAGFRKPTISITNDPASAARSIVRKFGLEFARQLKDAL